MPKEMIEGAWFGKTARQIDYDDDGKEVGSHEVQLDDAAVKVGWSKESEHLEIAVVEMQDGVFIEHASEAYPDSPGPRYIQMDRRSTNRLIRTLQKARDAAFGKDA